MPLLRRMPRRGRPGMRHAAPRPGMRRTHRAQDAAPQAPAFRPAASAERQQRRGAGLCSCQLPGGSVAAPRTPHRRRTGLCCSKLLRSGSAPGSGACPLSTASLLLLTVFCTAPSHYSACSVCVPCLHESGNATGAPPAAATRAAAQPAVQLSLIGWRHAGLLHNELLRESWQARSCCCGVGSCAGATALQRSHGPGTCPAGRPVRSIVRCRYGRRRPTRRSLPPSLRRALPCSPPSPPRRSHRPHQEPRCCGRPAEAHRGKAVQGCHCAGTGSG